MHPGVAVPVNLDRHRLDYRTGAGNFRRVISLEAQFRVNHLAGFGIAVQERCSTFPNPVVALLAPDARLARRVRSNRAGLCSSDADSFGASYDFDRAYARYCWMI